MAAEANDHTLYDLGIALFEPAFENRRQEVTTLSETFDT